MSYSDLGICAAIFRMSHFIVYFFTFFASDLLYTLLAKADKCQNLLDIITNEKKVTRGGVWGEAILYCIGGLLNGLTTVKISLKTDLFVFSFACNLAVFVCFIHFHACEKVSWFGTWKYFWPRNLWYEKSILWYSGCHLRVAMISRYDGLLPIKCCLGSGTRGGMYLLRVRLQVLSPGGKS